MLKIKEINIGYQKELICEPFSASITSPQTIALIGHNGTGKTTLLKTLAGLIYPRYGNILINGKELSSLSYTEKSRLISIVLTGFPPYLNLTPEEILKNTANITGKKTEKALIKAIELTGISDILTKKFHNLSDGQKQKVMIARALAQNTPILLLDEPFIHLDNTNKQLIINTLNSLKKEKIIIFSTHDYMTLQYSDRVWEISAAKITDQNTEKFLTTSQHLKDFYNFYSTLTVKQKKIKINDK